ncbi:MAG: TadE/TadG family type IV pilus assembly protein [Aeoliella sp.]
MKVRNSRNYSRGHKRGGVAAAEFAVCLPVIVLLILAMIESCTMIFLKQSVSIAAYEGVRTALLEDAVAADVLRTGQQILTERRVRGGSITINPNDFQRLPVGEYIEVTVSAPADLNSVIPGSFFRGKTLTGKATMMKEL